MKFEIKLNINQKSMGEMNLIAYSIIIIFIVATIDCSHNSNWSRNRQQQRQSSANPLTPRGNSQNQPRRSHNSGLNFNFRPGESVFSRNPQRYPNQQQAIASGTPISTTQTHSNPVKCFLIAKVS